MDLLIQHVGAGLQGISSDKRKWIVRFFFPVLKNQLRGSFTHFCMIGRYYGNASE